MTALRSILLFFAAMAAFAAPATARGPRDVAYGPEPRQRLDIYLPRAAEKAPRPRKTLVFIHGGGWTRGHKDRYGFLGRAFARAGYVVVVTNYRLYPQAAFPAFVEDAAKAVAWVRANIAGHGGDPERIYLMGHSAGAHIAALVALDPRYLRTVKVPRAAIKGMIGLAGPYVFEPKQLARIAPIFAAHPHPNARPVVFAGKGGPPLLLLSAGLDAIVGAKNGPGLAAAHRGAGGQATARSYSGIGHNQVLLAIAPALSFLAPVRADVVRFIGKP